MRIEESVRIAASKEEVWQLAGDPGRYPRFFADLAWFQHSGGPERGLGARYELRLRVGATGVGGLIEVVEYDEPWELAWTAVRGLYHRGRFRLRDAPGGGTEVTFRLLYESPSLGASNWAALAFAVDTLAAPLLRGAVRRTCAATTAGSSRRWWRSGSSGRPSSCSTPPSPARSWPTSRARSGCGC